MTPTPWQAPHHTLRSHKGRARARARGRGRFKARGRPKAMGRDRVCSPYKALREVWASPGPALDMQPPRRCWDQGKEGTRCRLETAAMVSEAMQAPRGQQESGLAARSRGR